jgi:hypothetical protein
MATITLVQAAAQVADGIYLMTAMPMNVDLQNLTGGAIQFSCTNPFDQIRGAKSVKITYDAAYGSGHQIIDVSSVIL